MKLLLNRRFLNLYEKGFYIKNDYYNGINAAYLLNVRGKIADDQNDAIADYTIAKRIRVKVVNICKNLYSDDCFEERSDRYWIVATLEEAYFALGFKEKYTDIRKVSESLSQENWERKTTEEQISKLKILIE